MPKKDANPFVGRVPVYTKEIYMAIAVGTTAAQANNIAMRDAVLKVAPLVQQLVQNSSQISAAEITLIQTAITACKTAFTTAGA